MPKYIIINIASLQILQIKAEVLDKKLKLDISYSKVFA